RSIRWLDVTRLRQLQETFWELWSLPIKKPAPRYTPTANAPTEAKDRVFRAAVNRQPMYVAYGAANPGAAPGAGGGDAVARVAQVQPEVDRWLDKLLHDLSAPINAVTDTHTTPASSASAPSGELAIPIEPLLVAA